MSEKSISDVLQDIKKLEERGTISHEEKDTLWRRALQEGPSDDLIDDIEVYRNRQTTPADTKKAPAPQRQPSSQPPAIGIVAIALGGVSLVMPYIVNLALVPVALVCGFVAYHSPASRKLGRIALILSVISLIFVLYTSNKISNVLSPSKPLFATSETQAIVTASEYRHLYEGMSYRDAVRVIGEEGTETSSTRIGDMSSASYQWVNEDGSNVMTIFVDDRLTTKSQFGLK